MHLSINKEKFYLQEGDEDYVMGKHPFRIYVTYNTQCDNNQCMFIKKKNNYNNCFKKRANS